MWLQDFSYYFSVTGDEGGLFSVEFNFCPGAAPGRRLSPAQEKDAVREDFSALDALLEKTMPSGVFGGKTKKTPTLSDSPAGSRVGFIYRNRLTHTANLEYHLHKTSRQTPATVQLKLRLGHRMNLSFSEKIMALPGLQASEEAQSSVRQMRAVLETKRRGNIDPVGFLRESGG